MMELLDGRVGEKSLVVSLDLLIESGSKPRMEILEETRTLPKLEADCLEMSFPHLAYRSMPEK